ncbi:MAG TPA: glycerophosphodiester phosphodiesterase [Candidatus Sulfotelmatobacter sp.]|nr:glycerophosphodiester phosphodiesterase [Candidatus Sulfotelmatobacter sp.]
MAEFVGRPLLLGHRGARAVKSIPENTIASFDRCLADGCDGFEFDVRLTADGAAVLCHNPEFKGVEIAGATARELPELARLEEVLTRYEERAFLDIELKVGGLEKITAELLRKHQPRRGYVVSSFLPEVLRVLRWEDSTIPLGLICETRSQLLHWNQLEIEYVIPHQKVLNATLVRRFQDSGKKILVWTVNAQTEMRRLADSGVDGIISDNAALLCRTLAG